MSARERSQGLHKNTLSGITFFLDPHPVIPTKTSDNFTPGTSLYVVITSCLTHKRNSPILPPSKSEFLSIPSVIPSVKNRFPSYSMKTTTEILDAAMEMGKAFLKRIGKIHFENRIFQGCTRFKRGK